MLLFINVLNLMHPLHGNIFLLLITYLQTLKSITMRSILYLIAVILVIGWILGFFVYSAGGLIHILIVLAVISLILGLIRST
ncbi:MAG: lmo0937 family membrane protein [Niastella sp.]|jgi:hypothetical protein